MCQKGCQTLYRYVCVYLLASTRCVRGFVIVCFDVCSVFWTDVEFWKQIPSNEPYRAILGDVRDKLYNTRERARQLLSSGVSDVPEDAVCTSVDQVRSLALPSVLKNQSCLK